MTTYLLAGGGTAGHVNPLLAVADLLRERDGDTVLVLGTAEGLESRLVPERGYELLIVDKVPFPRRPNRAAAAFPARFQRAVRGIPAANSLSFYSARCRKLRARCVGSRFCRDQGDERIALDMVTGYIVRLFHRIDASTIHRFYGPTRRSR